MTKWNFPLEITSLRNGITLHQHLQLSIETQVGCLKKNMIPSYIISNLSYTLHFSSRQLELAQMSHPPHLTSEKVPLSFRLP